MVRVSSFFPRLFSSRQANPTFERAAQPLPSKPACPERVSRFGYKPYEDMPFGVKMANDDHGVLWVLEVAVDSPADIAGIAVGDMVHRVNGVDVSQAAVACMLLRTAPAMCELEIVVTTKAIRNEPSIVDGKSDLPVLPDARADHAPVLSFEEEIARLSKQVALAPLAPVPSTSMPSPSTWDAEVAQMSDMGFADVEAARQAIEATGGDVQAAISRLLDNGGAGDAKR